MAQSSARASFRQSLLKVVQADKRIVGLLEGGSGGERRVDQWSDLDVFLFLNDADMEAFMQTWKTWIEQCGYLLLAYHPEGQVIIAWTIFHADPLPLRVDFRFFPTSQIETIRTWPTSPHTLEEFVLVDKTHGKLSAVAQNLVSQSQRLPDSQEAETFDQFCNRMWYFLHSAYCKLQRGDQWYARISFHIAVLDSLIALLKLEAGIVERWLASFPTWKLEHFLSQTRMEQLNACIPLVGPEALKLAMYNTAQLGQDVCETLATQRGWMWPREAAEAVIQMLEKQETTL